MLHKIALQHCGEAIFKRVLESKTSALITFSDEIAVRREVPDVPFCDEGIALAISEEQNGADGTSQSTAILTEKVIKAKKLGIEQNSRERKITLPTHVSSISKALHQIEASLDATKPELDMFRMKAIMLLKEQIGRAHV